MSRFYYFVVERTKSFTSIPAEERCQTRENVTSTASHFNTTLIRNILQSSKPCQFKVCSHHPLYYCIMFTRSSLSCLLAFYGIPIFHTFYLRKIPFLNRYILFPALMTLYFNPSPSFQRLIFYFQYLNHHLLIGDSRIARSGRLAAHPCR